MERLLSDEKIQILVDIVTNWEDSKYYKELSHGDSYLLRKHLPAICEIINSVSYDYTKERRKAENVIIQGCSSLDVSPLDKLRSEAGSMGGVTIDDETLFPTHHGKNPGEMVRSLSKAILGHTSDNPSIAMSITPTPGRMPLIPPRHFSPKFEEMFKNVDTLITPDFEQEKPLVGHFSEKEILSTMSGPSVTTEVVTDINDI